jgi:tetratricopeptide (TPR) repeat protein
MIELAGDERIAGRLTFGLVQVLRDRACRRSTYGQILEKLRQTLMVRPQQQRPIFAGNPDHFLFGGTDPYLDSFDLAERRNYAGLSGSEMKRRYGTLAAEAGASLPEMHINYGRALLEKEEVPEALQALRRAGDQGEGQHLESEVTLGAVQVLTGQHEEAAARLARAAQLAEVDGEMVIQLGRMLLLLEDHERAAHVLEGATRQDGGAPLEARFYQALAHGMRGNKEAAAAALDIYLAQQETEKSPATHRRYAEWLAHGSTKHALLIGIGEYEHAPALRLLGPRSEVGRLREVLISRYGFSESNLISLVDKDATHSGVQQAFEQLRDAVLPGDFVLVYYSGHVVERRVLTRDLRRPESEDLYLTHDVDDQFGNGIPGSQLDSWLEDIPTWNKLAVFDAGGPTLLRLARSAHDGLQAGRYDLLISAPPGQTAWEGTYEQDGQQFHAGLFAHHFIQRLWAADPESTTVGDIVDAVGYDIRGKSGTRAKGGYDEAVTSPQGPTPVYVGDRDRILFSPGPGSTEFLPRARYVYDEILASTGPETGARDLLSYLDRKPARNAIRLLSQHITTHAKTDAAAYLDLGIAYAAAGELEKGVAALTQAKELAGEGARPEARYHLGRVLLEQGKHVDAAVEELRQAVTGHREIARAHYYLGRALLAQARRDIFAEAAKAFQVYLDGGAPLGELDAVQEFLRSRAPEQDSTTGTR